MFERFTDRARRVIVLAQEEARALQHNYIGTEHLLLGLIREGEGVAAKALEAKGVTLEDTRKQVEEMIGKGNAAPNGHIPFTPHAKQVLELSLREALQLGHSYIGTEHILLGLIREGEGVGTQVLIKMDVDLGELRSTTIDMIRGNAGGTDDKGDLANAGGVQDKHAQSGSAILDQFGRNLTAEAADGKLDPVIGRSTEIERVMVVLSRRTKNNPVLIGEPGVGKTAVVEGLAQKIVAGDVPETLRGKQVYSLDLGSMVAGSRYRGDFEERLKKVLKEIKTRGDIVLFIDEIHRLPRAAEELLYIAMEDFRVDVMVGKGPGASSIPLTLPRFTVIGATTREGMLPSPLRARFGFTAHLDFYPDDELEKLIERSAAVLSLSLAPGSSAQLARRSRGTPRIANRLLRRVRDWAVVHDLEQVEPDDVKEALALYQIDTEGLDRLDMAVLNALIRNFNGGPVGLNNLSAMVGEEAETVETVCEPYLVREGFMMRTPKGRVATARAWEHLGLVPADDAAGDVSKLF